VLRALCHSDKTGWTDISDLARVSDLRADPESLVWGEVDVADLGPSDRETMIEEFELDPMAVDDALRPRQRPKLESYDRHRFAVLHQLYELDEHLEKRQISCFVGDAYMLIVHEGAGAALTEARGRLQRDEYTRLGPLYLLYTLVDTIVDEYQQHADRLEEKIETIEDHLVHAASRADETDSSRLRRHRVKGVQLDVYAVKQQLARLRRYAVPLERVLRLIVTNDKGLLSKDARRLFRDVHDHTERIADQIHQVDALSQAVLDLTRGEQAEDLNETQKKLSAWAAIFAIPTVIAGIYGMNYRLFPAARPNEFGFWFAIGLMAAASLALYAYFKNKEWI
jgi:magnesium transporter